VFATAQCCVVTLLSALQREAVSFGLPGVYSVCTAVSTAYVALKRVKQSNRVYHSTLVNLFYSVQNLLPHACGTGYCS
jgi:hypothetical protein